jgi:predicted glycoside hydrolase/deacetylase ChbG (UPF0249 family)
LRRLIINADDFGLTPGVNRAIIECHQTGAVTSATLMATGSTMAQAVAAVPSSLSVGCHVVLVDGAPVLPAREIPSLAFAEGGTVFAPTLGSFLQRVGTARFSEQEIEAEATAQFRKLQNAGVALSHFDTHKHTHVFPAILRPLLKAAQACGIPALRNPFVPVKPLPFDELRARPSLWKRYLQVRALRRFFPAFHDLVREYGMFTPDGSLGVIETGVLDEPLLAAIVRGISDGLPEGTWELVCHPGYDDADLAGIRTRLRASRAVELQALTSPALREKFAKAGVELISYRNLASA